MPKNLTSPILCFPSELLDRLGRFQGISTDVDSFFPRIVTPPDCRYVIRAEAENDPSFKQVIPYVLFVYNGSIFSYRRGKRGSEKRLHDLYSVGIGGHIETVDRMLFSQDTMGYYDALRREVAEEVNVACDCQAECVALINDDSNDVGRVHFGVVHVVRLDDDQITKNESKIAEPQLIPIEKAIRNVESYETWSQLCLRSIDLIIKKTVAS